MQFNNLYHNLDDYGKVSDILLKQPLLAEDFMYAIQLGSRMCYRQLSFEFNAFHFHW